MLSKEISNQVLRGFYLIILFREFIFVKISNCGALESHPCWCVWLVWHCLQGSGRSSELGYFFANADTNYQGKEKMGGSYLTNNSNSGITDIDPMDLTESMQEAMHRSNIEMRCVWNADFLVLSSLVIQLSKEWLYLVIGLNCAA